MTRYLRLFGYFVRFSLSKAMEFRLDFTFRIVMDTIFYLVNIGFFIILFKNIPSLAGWNRSQILVFVSGALWIDAFQMTLFSNNIWWIPVYINRGDLDYYLVRPVSSLFFLSLRDFAVNSFVNLIIATVIVGWAIGQCSVPMPAWKIGLFFLGLSAGTLLYTLVHLLLLIPVFWMHSARGLDMIFYHITKMIERPDGIFTGWVRRVLVTVVPVGVMASFPARLALDPFHWTTLAHLLAVTVVFSAVTIGFWEFGLKSYSSASS